MEVMGLRLQVGRWETARVEWATGNTSWLGDQKQKVGVCLAGGAGRKEGWVRI